HTVHFLSIFVGVFQSKMAFCTDEIVMSDINGAKAAGEYCQTLIGKSQDRAGHLLYFRETFLSIVSGQCCNLHRLVAEEIACGIDTVAADVEERSATEFLFHPNISRLHLRTKDRSEIEERASISGLRLFTSMHVCIVE